jgi:hypothetical protein
MRNAVHLTIRYEDAGDGWLTAQVTEVPSAISEGKTREEARANVIDALDVLRTPDEGLAGGAPVEDRESAWNRLSAWAIATLHCHFLRLLCPSRSYRPTRSVLEHRPVVF